MLSNAIPMLPTELRGWIGALREPEQCANWDLAQWQHAVRMARRLRLLGRLAECLDARGLMPSVPPAARNLLLAEQRQSRWRLTVTHWAAKSIGAVLADVEYPRVLLKGAAYSAQTLPISAGRLPSDLDILVPKAGLADAIPRLAAAGWEELKLDAHDQRYYREWSHESPPMHHPAHQVELDLHHNILPPVARTTVNADLLLKHLRASAWSGWSVLQPLDQILHCAAHLFFDSELRDRVRDLVDLDGLLRHFEIEPNFWPALAARAAELGLSQPLALAIHFLQKWFGTPMPADFVREVCEAGLRNAQRVWLPSLIGAVLEPSGLESRPPLTQSLAATGVLMRHHFHRMPMSMLVPHFWHKWRTRGLTSDETANAP